MSVSKQSLDQDFVVLSPGKAATIEKFDATLYERLNTQYNGFQGHELISCHEFDNDWSSWEMHPEGDEIVMLLSGAATFVLKLEAGEQSVSLDRAGDYVIVPRQVWHTARTRVKTKMLFVTPGENTQHQSA